MKRDSRVMRDLLRMKKKMTGKAQELKLMIL